MGTRYEDQPADHWAGPESLDPTPVWKQYLLVALLLLVALVAIVVGGLFAVAPQLATPPALVPGDRLVLAASDVPAVGAAPRLIAAPLVSEDRAFWLAQPVKGEVYALRRSWSFVPDVPPVCDIRTMGRALPEGRSFIGHCPDGRAPTFGGRGDSFEGPGMRDLDRYLVSVSGDRVIVNLSRLIRPAAPTSGPAPTGIPQPQRTP